MRIKSELDLPPAMRDQVRKQLGSDPRGTAAPAEYDKPNKYRNEVVEFDGKRFGSKWELRRWQELQEQQAAGLICELRHHVAFPLHVRTPAGNLVRIASYEADFVYRRAERLVIEDTKSEPTRRKESYQLKAKHFEAEYGMQILEVLRARRPRRSHGAQHVGVNSPVRGPPAPRGSTARSAGRLRVARSACSAAAAAPGSLQLARPIRGRAVPAIRIRGLRCRLGATYRSRRLCVQTPVFPTLRFPPCLTT